MTNDRTTSWKKRSRVLENSPRTRLAKVIGYRVVVADPRKALASRERFPDADELLHLWPDAAFARLRVTDRTAVVLLSHDPKFDRPGLLARLGLIAWDSWHSEKENSQ